MSEDYILELKQISKEFPGVRALDLVDFQLSKGEIHALVGENGAGKSTLMKILSGVYPKGEYSGEIILNGREVEFTGIKESENAGISVIYQELALVPYLSVMQNLFLGNEKSSLLGIDWIKEYVEAERILKRVGLDIKPDTHIINLGIGHQQLVEIAKALLKDTRILVLDEPTAALNEYESENLLNILRELKNEGISSIFISHKLEEVLQIADSITVLRDGGTVASTKEGNVSEDLWSEKKIIKYMVGRTMENRFPRVEHMRGDKILELKNWTVFHPEIRQKKIIDNLDLDIYAGEVLGIAGLMGAGRTEFATSIFGTFSGKVEGLISIEGVQSAPLSTKECIKKGILYATEDRKNLGLVLNMDVRVNETIAILERLTRYGISIDEHEEEKIAHEFCRRLTIKTPSLNQKAGNLSGGNQQKIVLAKWIMAEPKVLILDEPTRGIDVGAKYEIYKIINALASEGIAIVMISSELPEVLGMSDNIAVFYDGRIQAYVGQAEATPERIMHYATGGR